MRKSWFKRLIPIILIVAFVLIPFSASAETKKPEAAPKYIFYIIGDGMGETHLEIGRIFTKLMSGDMAAEPAYMDFPVHITADGGADSSQGGTMLATGVTMPAGYISTDKDGHAYTTILDIGKANGLRSGVITAASLIDGTPAAFLSHATKRSMMKTIARCFPSSGVDFVAGGGVERLFSKYDLPDELKIDASGSGLTNFSTENIAVRLEDAGYDLFLGLPGAERFFDGGTRDEKTFAAFTGGSFPFYYLQRLPSNAESMMNTPRLEDIAREGIANLSSGPDGFIVMIEASAIDDACHQRNAKYIAAEMGVLEKTLSVVMEFYAAHPDETLIILTADHETGNQTFSEGAVDEMSRIAEALPWNSDSRTIRAYLYTHFHAPTSQSAVEQALKNETDNTFGNTFDNRLIGVCEMTARVQDALGIRQHTGDHSGQPVPVMAIGAGSDAFQNTVTIADIPHIICDVTGWEDTLGTTMPNEE